MSASGRKLPVETLQHFLIPAIWYADANGLVWPKVDAPLSSFPRPSKQPKTREMNYLRIKHQPFLLLSLLLFAQMAHAQTHKPMDAFFKVCMGSLGNQPQGEQAARALGLLPASEEEKKTLLRIGATGRVYVGEKMAVILESTGLCTVMAYAADKTVVQQDLEKSLPPASSPFTVAKEILSDSGDVTSTVYHLNLPTGPFADWIISNYHRSGKYNLAISLQLRRAS